MIDRPKYLRQKDVFLCNDVPVKKEIEKKEAFSSASNMNLLTTLRTGRINTFNQAPVQNHKGIKVTQIHATYLDYSYFGEVDVPGNFDFKKELLKKRDLKEIRIREEEDDLEAPSYLVEKDTEILTNKSIPKHTYYKLEHQKDVYMSFRLKEQLDFLLNEIKEVKPKLIILTGKWSLFFLTGKISLAQTSGNIRDRKPLGGLVTYRASLMEIHSCFNLPDPIVVPIYHPISSMSMPDKIPMLELDIQKVGKMYHNILEHGTSFYTKQEKIFYATEDKVSILGFLDSLLKRLDKAPLLVSLDIETMFGSIIDCIGIADSITKGLCIPFAKVGSPIIWSLEDEIEIMTKLYEVMTHKNCQHIGQNYTYDCQYYHKLWSLSISATWDSMVMHHVLYNYLPKDLAFLASLYCPLYTYWKGEIDATKESPETRWEYNCKDVMYTLEIVRVLQKILKNQTPQLQDFYAFQQLELSPVLDKVMNKGVKIDITYKEEMFLFFDSLLQDVTSKLQDLIGEPFNINSTPQKKKIFSNLLGITLLKKKGGSETCDASALLSYIGDYPLYKPFLSLLREQGSLKVFVNTFLKMQLDEDNRARTQYKIAGPDTYRLASTKNAFGKSGNLQNIPEKGKVDLEFSEQVYIENNVDNKKIQLPNCKIMFLPDEGYTFFNADFKGADAQIVAFDSNCKFLMDIFQDPTLDLYSIVAGEYYGRKIEKSSKERTQFKAVCHATAYLGSAPTIAKAAGLLVHEVSQVQKWYFQRCPEVKKWQDSIIRDISIKGYTENIFGARGWYLNRNDPMLKNKAVAWRGQSVIAILCNKGLVNIQKVDKRIQPLLQIHDAIAGQFKTDFLEAPKLIRESMLLPLPYKIPLTIDVDFDIYTKGYGSPKLKNHNYKLC